ncbi:MAG TPA: hypothetical protein VE243_08095 [Candidatus Acidoferrum sp.]|nr:hypothetical protein [Candidatus Acidoferrum sp.]
MRQHALAQLDAVLPGVHRLGAKYQTREIELEVMTIMRRVGTFDFAELASVAEIDDARFLGRRHPSHIAVVAIDGVEQRRKRRAQIEAQAAARADVENALDFLIESGALPVLRFGGVVSKAVSRPRLNSFRHQSFCDCSPSHIGKGLGVRSPVFIAALAARKKAGGPVSPPLL